MGIVHAEGEHTEPETSREDLVDEEELRKEVLKLVSEILHEQVSYQESFATRLTTSREDIVRRSFNRTIDALSQLDENWEEMLAKRKVSLEETCSSRRQEACREKVGSVSQCFEDQLEGLQQEAERALAGGLLDHREHLGGRLLGIHTVLTELQGLGSSSESLQQRSIASSEASATLLSLDRALSENACSEDLASLLEGIGRRDDFVQHLLRLLPQEVLARSRGAALSELHLRHRFQEQVQDIAATALAPPSNGLAGQLIAAGIGKLLASLYVLPAASDHSGIPVGTAIAQQNLMVLAAASSSVEQGDLHKAVVALQGLGGACSDKATSWAQEAREALLLQQTARAVQARVRCLNAALNPSAS